MKSVEVFDGAGLSPDLFVERTVDLFCQAFPDLGKKADRGKLESMVRGLVVVIEKDIESNEQRVANEAVEDLVKVRYIQCSQCGGSGQDKDDSSRTCAECEGAGKVMIEREDLDWGEHCNRCDGTGVAEMGPDFKCPDCSGSGRILAADWLLSGTDST